jgi:hypothetical protein
MPVARQGKRQFLRCGPRFAFIVADREQRIELAVLLADEQQDLLAVRRANGSGLGGPGLVHHRLGLDRHE